MNPGWYPDPYSHGWLRWWDGAAWTSHTAPMGPPPGTFYRADPQEDLAGEQRAARRALITVVVSAVVGAGYAVLFAAVFGSQFRTLVDSVREHRIGDTTYTSYSTPAGTGFSWLFTIATFGLQVFFMIWLYRAAGVARKAGLPARRDPVWAILGFIIPVVNFWFPYQVARDSFAPTDARRGVAARWWTWYLISTLLGAVVVVAAIFSTVAGVAVALVDIAAYALSAWYARRMIVAIGEAHSDLVRSFDVSRT